MSPRRARVLGVVLVLATFASRLPFVRGAGLGLDPDAWRLVLAGRTTAATGEYTLSRPPGYPLLELLSAAAPWAPQAALTTATALVTALGVGAMAVLCRDLGVRAWWLPPAGFALTGVVYRTSTSFLDYDWSVALLLAAFVAVLRRRTATSGVLLGLAVAARPATAAAGAVVVVVVLTDRWWTWRRAVVGAAAALAVAGSLYAAPLLRYGPGMITARPVHPGAAEVLRRATTGVFGLLGVVGVGAGVLLALARAVGAARDARAERAVRPAGAAAWSWWTRPRAWAAALVVGLGVQACVFVALPVDPGYLVPAVAMLWLLLGIGLGRGALAGVAALVAAGAFVPAQATAALLPAHGSAAVLQDSMTVLQEHRARLAQVRAAAPVLARVEALPRGSVVVARGRLPILLVVGRVPVPPGEDPAGLSASIPLPGGQVLTHDFAPGDGVGAPVYRVPGVGRVPGWVPALPPAPVPGPPGTATPR